MVEPSIAKAWTPILEAIPMQQPNGLLQVAGEMVSIVLLALTGRFIGFAQNTLESGTPLSVGRAFGYIGDTLGIFAP